jgi:hypothetical protein
VLKGCQFFASYKQVQTIVVGCVDAD